MLSQLPCLSLSTVIQTSFPTVKLDPCRGCCLHLLFRLFCFRKQFCFWEFILSTYKGEAACGGGGWKQQGSAAQVDSRAGVGRLRLRTGDKYTFLLCRWNGSGLTTRSSQAGRQGFRTRHFLGPVPLPVLAECHCCVLSLPPLLTSGRMLGFASSGSLSWTRKAAVLQGIAALGCSPGY